MKRLKTAQQGEITTWSCKAKFKPHTVVCSTSVSKPQPSRPADKPIGRPLKRLCYQHIRQDALLEQETAEAVSESRGLKLSPQPQRAKAKTFNDPSAGSPTETLLRLLLPLNASVWSSSRSPVSVSQEGHNPRTSLKRSIGSSDGRCVQRAGT